MPATDAYWRNIKKTHVVFALSSVAMLAVTIWMMWHDHNREYFDHQRTFEALEVYKARARLASLDTKRFEDELKELNERLAEEKRKLDGSKDYADINARIKVNKLKMTLAESRLKLLKSQMSKAVADKDLATRDEKPESVIHARQAVYEAKKKQVDQQAVVVEKLQSEQDELQKQLKNLTRTYDGIKAKRDQKQKEVVTIRKGMLKIEPENWFLSGKRKIMEWPIIQGFNSHLKVHQDWLPKLEITLGMTRTARFDRCRTCHLGIDKVEAGNVPSFPHGKPDGKKPVDWVAENKYPHPYSTHPNPDLYLTATSPHPVSRFGCTICHDGNGSGTSFQNAEHGPNSPHDAREWKKKHHYHSNHFWEYPMQPKRLLQSGCIKCHHQVEELGVNPKYGASAPTVYKGFRLIQQYGCFGCHPVNGFERGKSIGPDMRLEPNYTESALQFRFLTKSWEKSETASGFSVSAAKEYLAQIIDSPEDSESARSKLVEMIQKDLQAKKDAQKKLAVQRVTAAQRAAMKRKIDASHLPDEALALGASFKSVENPGIYRKVGPSLRSVRQKTSRAFLRYWTEEPKRFRPTTRMPQFFGLTNQQDPHAKKLTAVELAGVAQYLHDKSQPIDLLSPPKGYVPDPKRGKEFFSQKGCLACHTHQDVKGTAATFGPDLSRIAAKVKRDAGNPKFSKWLYTWIRDPQRYHKRSKMPYLFLEPKNVFEVVGGDRKRVMQDAAADITAYLLQGNEETENLRTKTFRNHADDRFPAVDETALDELVRLKLQGQVLTKAQTDALFNSKSHKYPITDRSQIKGDEIELAIGMEKDGSAKQWLKTRLNYIGRKTISKYGCYACHDIPGFEKARPIGTTLQDWGRKETSKLAFEHIKEYLQHHGEPNGGNTKQRVEQAMNKAKGNEFANDKTRDPRTLGRLLLQQHPAPRPTGFHLAETACPAKLRLRKSRNEGLRRTAEDAQIPVRGIGHRSHRDIRPGTGRRAAPAGIPVRPHRPEIRPRGRRTVVKEIQLRRLPHAGTSDDYILDGYQQTAFCREKTATRSGTTRDTSARLARIAEPVDATAQGRSRPDAVIRESRADENQLPGFAGINRKGRSGVRGRGSEFVSRTIQPVGASERQRVFGSAQRITDSRAEEGSRLDSARTRRRLRRVAVRSFEIAEPPGRYGNRRFGET